MDILRTAYKWGARAARLMVGVPDYETYVAHRRAEHPDEPIMTYEEFYLTGCRRATRSTRTACAAAAERAGSFATRRD